MAGSAPLFENPLFLPPGSIRAIIALALIGGTIYAYITDPSNVPEGLTTLASMVVTFYFVTKSKVV